ncbi:MAG: 4-hydroxy-tetrahydrodipicolinate reductase [Calditrichaeota bacterium]|nr:MAG: 4-hydroxy-tetrahydrodipicolinate reductase [Calditrichota bacterium]
MIRVAINGILGRMGQELASAISRDEDLILVGGIDTLETFHEDRIAVTTNPDEILGDADVVVDFSSPQGTATIARSCRQHHRPLITGTTGLSRDQQKLVEQLAENVPVVQSFNFSLGINLLIDILQKTARVLKDGFDVEIIDVHHRGKKDAPSGTALTLARVLAQTMGLNESQAIQVGRKGKNLKRGHEIVIHSLRGGAIIGEHQVHFLCGHETINITHKALSRSVFVDGVLRAIYWIPGQKPGYYTMQDVLELKA